MLLMLLLLLLLLLGVVVLLLLLLLLFIPETCFLGLINIGSVIAEILLTLSLYGLFWVGWGGLQSTFHVKPNLDYVRLRVEL